MFKLSYTYGDINLIEKLLLRIKHFFSHYILSHIRNKLNSRISRVLSFSCSYCLSAQSTSLSPLPPLTLISSHVGPHYLCFLLNSSQHSLPIRHPWLSLLVLALLFFQASILRTCLFILHFKFSSFGFYLGFFCRKSFQLVMVFHSHLIQQCRQKYCFKDHQFGVSADLF